MARIDPSAVWDFAAEVVGAVRADRGRTTATVTRIDADGTTWVTTGDGGESPATTCAAGVSVGDTVTLEWDGSEMGIRSNVSNPAPSGSVIRRVTERTRSVADAAQRVADAVNQHFFADTSGIHVTEAAQEDWDASHTGANVLINSIGQLFRDGLNNLLTLTTESGARALTIWDGLGNSASNILARFSSDGISFADGTSFDIGDSSSYIHFDGNGHINIGGSGLTIGGYIQTGGVTVSDLTQSAQSATLNSNMVDDIYQSAQPNLSPFFEIAPNDATYWFATNNLKTKTTPLGDGWSHVEYSSLNLNVSPRIGVLNLAPSTKYTVMLEVRNATALTNCRFYLYTDTNSMWAASVNTVVSANGTYYLTGQTKADLTDSAITHLRTFFGHNSSVVNADIRLSLYEGEYDGPFKPYSGTRLFATQTDASNAAKTATSYVMELTGQNGIMVHPSTDQTTGVRITDDVDILRDGTSVANYGTTARIGTSAGKHVSIDSDSVDLMDNTTELATFGANETHLGLGDGISSVFLANDKFRMRGVTQERTPTSGSGTLHETYGNILAETVWDGPTQDESWDPSTGHSYVSRAAIDTYALVPGNEASLKLTAKAMDWQGESPETRISSGGYGPDDFDPYVNASQTYEANIEIHSETANLTNSSYVYTTASRVGYYTDMVTYAMTNGDNEWSTPAGVLLWSSSGWAMAANVTATLSHNVSTCPSGIVLHWQAYANGATQDYDHVYTFIPKQHVLTSAGKGVVCQLANGGFGFVGTKYVYVSDGSISGHASNTQTGTSNGITYDNGHWVLTQVISA